MIIFFSNSITLVDFKEFSHSPNSLPQSLECRLDCRLMPEQDITEFIKSMEKTLKNQDVEIIVVDSLPGTAASSSSEIPYKKFEEALLINFPSCTVIPAILPGYSDCIHFRNRSIPSYGSNPFVLSMELLETFHNFNVRIPVSALKSGAKVYLDFLCLLQRAPDK